ncbi:MAG: metallophosphoesterase family protein [Beijerinckiaceae bacterium]
MRTLYPGPFGFVSDAHGNPHGLRASLDALSVKRVKTIFFLGDALGYLPLEAEVLALLRGVDAVCVAGNHEAMLLGRLPCHADDVYHLGGTRKRLSGEDKDYISSWPDQRVVGDSRAPQHTLLMVHGSPLDPLVTYIYPDSDLVILDTLDADILVCGHTHRPFQARRGSKLVVNCGSVGLPRDIGGSASCAFLDLPTLHCDIMRAPFDVELLIKECDRVEVAHPSVNASLRRSNTLPSSGEIQ